MNKKLSPIHPGEVLKFDFMDEFDLSARRLAQAIKVPPNRISDIVRGRRDITGDTALRLARYFDVSPQFWMGLQADHDLAVAEDVAGKEISKIKERVA